MASQPGGSNLGARAAYALQHALMNPYASQNIQPGYSGWNYTAQATTADGYTLSSTYAPAQHFNPVHNRFGASHFGFQHIPSFPRGPSTNSAQPRASKNSTRCTHNGCQYAGSSKEVEVHMMDRHLIYPPGWENRKRKREWDGDPALDNGKPVPVPGTGVLLDTPEAIEAWIAERKRRWPTTQRVEEKKRKIQEAKARGDLLTSTQRSLRPKRLPLDGATKPWQPRSNARRKGAHLEQTRLTTKLAVSAPHQAADAEGSTSRREQPDSDDSTSSDSDMDPERDAVSSKAVSASAPQTANQEFEGKATKPNKRPVIKIASRHPRQPRAPPHNPFSNRPVLLQSLLQPEISQTISHLSQTIRFLARNNFLEEVELEPGDADRQPGIEIIGGSSADAEAIDNSS